jgi:hypothetical protein
MTIAASRWSTSKKYGGWKDLNNWNDLNSRLWRGLPAVGLQLGIHFPRDCKVEKSVQRWSVLDAGAFENHVEGG